MTRFTDLLKKSDPSITNDQITRINERIGNILNYTPKIGVFGKTGVGKSSLCNALFGKNICKVSDVEACTRRPQDVLLKSSNGRGISLLDVPGVGESAQRDAEYSAMYETLLPELDLVLWVLKADDRAYSVDIDFYNNVVKPHIKQGKPFIIVLNQADKIEPFREWDVENRLPGKKQMANLLIKKLNVSQCFSVKQSSVITVSADEKYGLTKLVDEMIFSLPDEKRYSVSREAEEEYVSDEAKEEVNDSLWRSAVRVVEKVVDKAVDLVADISGAVSSGFRSVASWFGF